LQGKAFAARKLYMRIAEDIRDAIERGDLLPGDRLPPLAEMAASFGCSRTTVREALSTLRGQGLVEFQHGNGIYVRTASLETWMEPLEAAILLGQSDMMQLVETETAILGGIVTAVATRCQDINFTPLSRTLFQLECAPPGGEEAIAAELSFYLAIADCCGNPMLDNAFRVLLEAFRSTLRLLHRHFQLGPDDGRQLLDYLVRGEPRAAREVVYQRGELLRAAVVKGYRDVPESSGKADVPGSPE